MVSKSKLDGYYNTKLRDEIEVLSELNHVHVIRLYEVIEEPKMYYMIFEKMAGGELFNRIVKKRFFTELEVRDTGRMLLGALDHCHEHMIAHRDLKPENILFDVSLFVWLCGDRRVLCPIWRDVCPREQENKTSRHTYSDTSQRLSLALYTSLSRTLSLCWIVFETSPSHTQTDNDDANLKLADFGLAKKLKSPDSLRTQCGTPAYVAPEILNGQAYGTQVDMWSFGVVIYILLGGYPPFHEECRQDLYTLIRRGDYEFHSDYWSEISSDAKNLIARCLTVDPQQRYTPRTALKMDKWMTQDERSFLDRNIQKKTREPSLERTASLGHYASSTSLMDVDSAV
jgi:serine/threonine protein kinase